MGMCSHGWMAWATPGMDEGADEWTKLQAVMWACAAMDDDVRAGKV